MAIATNATDEIIIAKARKNGVKWHFKWPFHFSLFLFLNLNNESIEMI